MKVGLVEIDGLSSAVENIDGGCETCILRFLKNLKPAMNSQDFESLLKALEKTENYWAKGIRNDLAEAK